MKLTRTSRTRSLPRKPRIVTPESKPSPAGNRVPLIWLETNTCGGNTLSFLNTVSPDINEFMHEYLDIRFWNTLSVGAGDLIVQQLEAGMTSLSGKFILVVEGSVPTAAQGKYCVLGRRNGQPWTAMQVVRDLAPHARYIVAVGSCAAFGGPFASAPNPSGSMGVSAFLRKEGVITRDEVISVSGCPAHPDWMVGTLTHLVRYGKPNVDAFGRPTMFYVETVHNRCTRRHYFESGIFASKPGEPWCMFKLGCKGPVTHADCPVRQWSSEHNNWPVGVNTPCIGCTAPEFIDGMSPFFSHLPDITLPSTKVRAARLGTIAGIVTGAGIAAHLLTSLITGRLFKTLSQAKNERRS